MINPIGNHSHRLHLGAAQGLSKADKAAEDPPAAPPTPQEKLDAKEAQKRSDKKNSDMMQVLSSAESMQMYNNIIGKPGLETKSTNQLSSTRLWTGSS
jgi:hypothetical protein